jgi:hypothetical protein
MLIAVGDQLFLGLEVVVDGLFETSASRASLTATCSYPRSANSRAAASAMTWRVRASCVRASRSRHMPNKKY